MKRVLALLLAAAFPVAALAQKPDDKKPDDKIPAPRPADPPKVAPKVEPLPAPTPSPGTLTSPYSGPTVYPGYGYGWAQGNLPPRIVYGPSVSPINYPYTSFQPMYPYPGYTMVAPYPMTASSYSYGPSAYPVRGFLHRPRY